MSGRPGQHPSSVDPVARSADDGHVVGLSRIERVRTLHDRELYSTGAERAARRAETNTAVLIAHEDGVRIRELAEALGLSVALTAARLERARTHANSLPLEPDMVPLAEFAATAGVPLAKARRLRRAGSIPSARWWYGEWWVRPGSAPDVAT